MSSVSAVLSVKFGRPVSFAQSGIARTISAAIWWRRVGSLGQNSGGVAEESQPLITPRAASASMATQAGSLAGTSPKRVPHGPVEGDGFGEGLAEGDGVAE